MSIFDKFKRTNATKEERQLPIDWCPRCGKKLPDSLESTKIEHDRLNHSKTRKEKVFIYLRTHALSLVVLFIVGYVIFAIFNLSDSVETECDIIGDEFSDKYSDVLLSSIPNEDIVALENVCAEENFKIWVVKRFDNGIRDQLLDGLFD